MAVTIQDLADIVRQQMAEIDRQRAVIAKQQAEIESLVAWASNDLDALMALQAIYRNPHTPEGNRLKAAAAAIGFERAKPPSTTGVVVVDFRERVRAARSRQLELDKAEWARQAEQKPLDLDAPTPSTILGGQGEDDPAA